MPASVWTRSTPKGRCGGMGDMTFHIEIGWNVIGILAVGAVIGIALYHGLGAGRWR